MSVNKVILVGNLGADPDIRTMQNGDRVAQMSIATSEKWKDKQTGERKEKTEWHRVVIFSQPLVNLVEQYVSKGSKLYLEGQLATRKWTDQQGIEKYTTEVVLRPFGSSLTMLDSKNGGGGPPPAGSQEDYGYNQNQSQSAPQQDQGGDGFEDEIPW